MFQFLVGVAMIFFYPFLNKLHSQILLIICMLICVVSLAMIDSSNWIIFIFISILIFGIGSVLRYYVQKSKNISEANELQDFYKQEEEN